MKRTFKNPFFNLECKGKAIVRNCKGFLKSFLQDGQKQCNYLFFFPFHSLSIGNFQILQFDNLLFMDND